MKQRILVAVVGIPALLAVLCIAPAWATALLLAALTVIAAHELLTAVCGPDKARRWTVLPAVCGVLLLARAVWPGCAALEEMVIPESLTFIGANAFARSSLTEITVLGDPTGLDSAFYNSLNLTTFVAPKLTTIG